MNTWKGLWKKEWQMMKSWLFATLVIAVLLILLVSFALSFLAEGMFGTALMMWILIVLCMPVSLLLNSMWIEWKRPDVWLHSPQSILQLFGSKVLFSAVVGFISMLVAGIALALYASFVDNSFAEVGVVGFAKMIYSFVSSLYFGAIMLMLIGLFLAVVYRTINSYVRRGAFFLWLVALFASLWLFQTVLESKLYQQIAHLGKLNTPSDAVEITVGNFYFIENNTTFYVGEILMVVGFMAFLFLSSAWLFEKKVRL
ncbi:hypothetical protein [Sporosarcina obsidiansis]|uniref:hypothetical protein n=1 Tax=Sporosarcina obsidiansis TaxID=2660748 RepID=UPI00129BBB22|nr:hypothetical protein [Sporosarcina obsidiansis]